MAPSCKGRKFKIHHENHTVIVNVCFTRRLERLDEEYKNSGERRVSGRDIAIRMDDIIPPAYLLLLQENIDAFAAICAWKFIPRGEGVAKLPYSLESICWHTASGTLTCSRVLNRFEKLTLLISTDLAWFKRILYKASQFATFRSSSLRESILFKNPRLRYY